MGFYENKCSWCGAEFGAPDIKPSNGRGAGTRSPQTSHFALANETSTVASLECNGQSIGVPPQTFAQVRVEAGFSVVINGEIRFFFRNDEVEVDDPLQQIFGLCCVYNCSVPAGPSIESEYAFALVAPGRGGS